MTRQPTVQGCVLLLVTVHAERHLKVHLNQTIVLLHISVADGTINLPPNVRLMIEFHIVGDVVNLHPRHRGLRVQMPSLRYNLRMLRNDIGMTEKTLTHRRDACMLRPVHIGVAEPATDLLHARMHPVTEVDGLFGPDRPAGIDVVKVKHHPEQGSRQQEKQNRVPQG